MALAFIASFVLWLLPCLPATSHAQTLAYFRDSTFGAGLYDARRLKKYGGPTVVDLDRDGYPDLLFNHHDSVPSQLFWNNGDGTFSRSSWQMWHDIHGINAFPISPWTRNMRFTLSAGGNFGRNPSSPLMYEVNAATRNVRLVSAQAGVTRRGGRGRTAVYMDLSKRAHLYWPDVLFINAAALKGSSQFAYEQTKSGRFTLRGVGGSFQSTPEQLGTVTDLEDDLQMEVLTYWTLRVWRVTRAFTLTEISKQVLPRGLAYRGVAAVAELDFDNDGDFDLYVARSRIGWWLPDVAYDDYLLENRGGYYVDVSAKARIPRGTQSRGVTTGDFNNDGFIDLHVTQYNDYDILLLNRGDGTFRRVSQPISRPGNTRGDHSVAFDYDMDGRIDIISSQGDHNNVKLGGSYRLFQNITPPSKKQRNYLLVRVGNPWNRSCTPLHAVVMVQAGKLRMKRRVGSPGTAVSNSYLETVHFGLGKRRRADRIFVKYSSGYVIVLKNVAAGRTVNIGWV
ncbi:hypothetical protein BWQ96_09892 [Gracilariopsis chorda]|uniref:ASPIC/UnbV domain-containing protein n=1 Tax=Gracilariopsis chorda TaxID=448386 RepID=A0A2V3IGX8_9FLOR|nr:hypothetical protein BWQ96_09892 [Gracilariopsis chorda]|eukprot:PXF40400.1 hypothetical protein BWQ96_09892 [Gracilariopsis chorda]